MTSLFTNTKKEATSMTTTLFINRTPAEQEIIRKAYDFEIAAIEAESSERNPYAKDLRAMGLWEALNEAVEMAFN